MSNVLDLCPGLSNIMTAFFLEVITFDIFYFMLCSTIINLSAWLSAEKEAYVNISMPLLFLILSKPKEFYTN